MKPCPFCGNIDNEVTSTLEDEVDENGDHVYYYYCSLCCCIGPQSKSKEQALEQWNLRYIYSHRNAICDQMDYLMYHLEELRIYKGLSENEADHLAFLIRETRPEFYKGDEEFGMDEKEYVFNKMFSGEPCEEFIEFFDYWKGLSRKEKNVLKILQTMKFPK